jgi:DHA1 family tetracycline resistance protein-like MFS transporter
VMYAVIFANLLGFTVTSAIQSIVSSAADARSQGQTLGAVSSINSLTAVLAPAIGLPLLGVVAHLPAGHWGFGAPLYFGSALLGCALLLALSHFRGERRRRHAESSDTAPANS